MSDTSHAEDSDHDETQRWVDERDGHPAEADAGDEANLDSHRDQLSYES